MTLAPVDTLVLHARRRGPLGRLDDYFFSPAAAGGLGACRFLFFAGLLALVASEDFSTWSTVARETFRPVYLFRRFGWKPIDGATVDWMQVVWFASLVTSAVGLLTNLSVAVALCLGAYLLGLPSSFGKIGHGDGCLIITMFLLLISRCGDALSLDAWIKKRGHPSSAAPSGEFHWPIVAVRVLLAVIFCAAGFTKLVNSGLAWVFSDHLQILIMQHRYGLKDVPWPAAATFLAERPGVCRLIAGGSLLLEIGFPAALFVRGWPRAAIVLSALLMQVMIGLLMGVYFFQFLLLYLFWLPWERWFSPVPPPPGAGSSGSPPPR